MPRMLLANITHALVIITVLSMVISIMDGKLLLQTLASKLSTTLTRQFSPGTLFAWHPTLMAIGFLGLMTEGILASISFRSSEGDDRVRKIWIHFAWQLMALAFILGGFWTIFLNKVENFAQTGHLNWVLFCDLSLAHLLPVSSNLDSQYSPSKGWCGADQQGQAPFQNDPRKIWPGNIPAGAYNSAWRHSEFQEIWSHHKAT